MRDLSRMITPKTIAVVGGGAWGRNIVAQCRKIGFQGDIWPVHPRESEIGGEAVFSSLADLPSAPDATFIGVNRNLTIEIVKSLADMSAGGAVCFASGFLEAQNETSDGADLQKALVAAAGDMPIIGPNCYGFINYLDDVCLWPDQHGGWACESGVAILTQSSNIAINLTMQSRGLPIAMVMTAGNQAQTSQAELGKAMLSDPRVTALGLHIEGLSSVREFEDLAQFARGLGKGIVALKVGKSAQAQAATISHTASLAGSDAGARAFLSRLGIAQVDSLSAMIETLKIFHVVGPLGGNRIASMSCSGGEASLMADAGQSYGLTFPPLGDDQKATLQEVLGPKVALANPLDYHTYVWGDGETMGRAFAAMLDAPIDIATLVVDFPRADRCDPSAWDCVLEAADYVKTQSSKPFACLASLPENLSEALASKMIERGIIPLCGIEEALEAISVCGSVSLTAGADPVLLPHPSKHAVTWSESAAKDALAQVGVPVPKRVSCEDLDALLIAFEEFTGPCVLKGMGFAHKSESGAVILGITDKNDLRTAAETMGCAQFLIEEMVEDALCELLVGVTHDPVHGFVLTLAAGGVWTEVLQDSVSLMLPANEQDIKTALSKLKISKILSGFRGKPAADMDAIVAVVKSVERFVINTQDHLEEVEINPLLALPHGAVAVDALIRIGETE